MPLILTQNEATESGHAYADVLGQSYEYPRRYRNQIRTGEQFAYYRGRRTSGGGLQPQVYLGTGVIGAITESADTGRLTCGIEDFLPFPEPLPFKDGETYLEPRAATYAPGQAGLYFRAGVRVVDFATFEAIEAAGWGDSEPPATTPPSVVSHEYASPEDLKAVDAVAMDLAMTRARSEWPRAAAKRMPHNNPGFDLRIEQNGEPDLFVEIKGTRRPTPVFFLTEGERMFATAHADRYQLWVFFEIDLEAKTGTPAVHQGALISPFVQLQPKQWAGALSLPAGSVVP